MIKISAYTLSLFLPLLLKLMFMIVSDLKGAYCPFPTFKETSNSSLCNAVAVNTTFMDTADQAKLAATFSV